MFEDHMHSVALDAITPCLKAIWMELEVIVTQYMPLEAISTCWDAIGMGLDVIVTC